MAGLKVEESIVRNLENYDMNKFHAVAIDRNTGKLVEMINVHTGEHRVITMGSLIKLILKTWITK